MLEKNYIITLFGAFGFISAPAARASPHSAITSHKVNQIAAGGQGDTPIAVPPPPGERGVTFVFFYVSEKMNMIRFYQSRFFLYLKFSQLSNSSIRFGSVIGMTQEWPVQIYAVAFPSFACRSRVKGARLVSRRSCSSGDL